MRKELVFGLSIASPIPMTITTCSHEQHILPFLISNCAKSGSHNNAIASKLNPGNTWVEQKWVRKQVLSGVRGS